MDRNSNCDRAAFGLFRNMDLQFGLDTCPGLAYGLARRCNLPRHCWVNVLAQIRTDRNSLFRILFDAVHAEYHPATRPDVEWE